MVATLDKNDTASVPVNSVYSELRALITVIDQLRDVGLSQIIKLPRIAVIGSQSAGKSSVLESIVGFDFLPRGEGVVTRMPLELRLVHVAEPVKKDEFHDLPELPLIESVNDPESGTPIAKSPVVSATPESGTPVTEPASAPDIKAVFSHDPKRVYTDLVKVRQHIIDYTDTEAGANKGIIDKSIVLTISGPSLPDLTLIDLPGVTRVPLRDSDQSDDIEQITRNMSLKFIEDPRTVILAVIPANQDVSTSDGLMLARRVDPEGLRTLGVITKVDMMDRGLNAMSMIKGEQVPLRLGYNAVICRSSADMADNVDVATARKNEENFFSRHSVYGRYFMVPEYRKKLGTKSLVEQLTSVLYAHIKKELPDIKREISDLMTDFKSKQSELGEGVPTEPFARLQLVNSLVQDFSHLVSNLILGRHDNNNYMDQMPQECGGAMIREHMFSLLKDPVMRPLEDEPSLSSDNIAAALSRHEGDAIPGLPSPDVFVYLVKPLLNRLESPVDEMVDAVYYEMESILTLSAEIVFQRFPSFRDYIVGYARQELDQCNDKACAAVSDVIEAQREYIFTSQYMNLTQTGDKIRQGTIDMDSLVMNVGPNANVDMADVLQDALIAEVSKTSRVNKIAKSVSDTVESVVDMVSGAASGEQPADEVTLNSPVNPALISSLVSRVYGYMHIVTASMKDIIPKTVGCFLVRGLQSKLQSTLVSRATMDINDLGTILEEPSDISVMRRDLANKITILSEATRILNKECDRGNRINLDGKSSHSRIRPPPSRRMTSMTISPTTLNV